MSLLRTEITAWGGSRRGRRLTSLSMLWTASAEYEHGSSTTSPITLAGPSVWYSTPYVCSRRMRSKSTTGSVVPRTELRIAFWSRPEETHLTLKTSSSLYQESKCTWNTKIRSLLFLRLYLTYRLLFPASGPKTQFFFLNLHLNSLTASYRHCKFLSQQLSHAI